MTRVLIDKPTWWLGAPASLPGNIGDFQVAEGSLRQRRQDLVLRADMVCDTKLIALGTGTIGANCISCFAIWTVQDGLRTCF